MSFFFWVVQVTEIDMWEELGDFWLEMMAYSATRCPVNVHAQKLRYGGEFLTHIWLLMAHFGLTHHHFQRLFTTELYHHIAIKVY